MAKLAQYIKSVEIKSLWNGRKHIVWNLNPEVNVLSGVNGVGKSTILNKMISVLRQKADHSKYVNGDFPGVTVEFEPADAVMVHFDIIRSFDSTLLSGNVVDRIADGHIRSELDWNLYELQRRYLNYQVNIGNKMIALLSSTDENARQAAMDVSKAKTNFQDIVDDLFCDTQKKIDRNSNELQFVQFGEKLPPYKLSSGEKQLLVILLTVLLEENEHYVLLMDEPEISLHVEWQQKLVNIIRQLNPNVQIILTTHSPAVIMNGWLDVVTDVADITMDETVK
ncbi:MAG: AAA family ATPase [Methanobrevibacter sp.]|nr:AAA family ATPase [Methanobrevibacter sp.]